VHWCFFDRVSYTRSQQLMNLPDTSTLRFSFPRRLLKVASPLRIAPPFFPNFTSFRYRLVSKGTNFALCSGLFTRIFYQQLLATLSLPFLRSELQVSLLLLKCFPPFYDEAPSFPPHHQVLLRWRPLLLPFSFPSAARLFLSYPPYRFNRFPRSRHLFFPPFPLCLKMTVVGTPRNLVFRSS